MHPRAVQVGLRGREFGVMFPRQSKRVSNVLQCLPRMVVRHCDGGQAPWLVPGLSSAHP